MHGGPSMPLPVINIPLFALSGVLGDHFGVCEGRSEGLFEVTLEPELTSQCFFFPTIAQFEKNSD